MTKYVIAGTGSRALDMFGKPLVKAYGHTSVLVGIYDINPKRAEYFKKQTGGDYPVYESFEEMLSSAKPDKVIVTTPDGFHHEYIIKTLEAGCDVISEKPLTTDDEKCRAIVEAEKRTGRKVTVTFNMRTSPYIKRIKKIIRAGTIGKVLNVHFEWLLDTNHGADYFRRWHADMSKSGGLLVHKATHHFDMVNWLIEQEPVKVNAYGELKFYGPTRENRGERCLTCRHAASCEFCLDLRNHEEYTEMYLDCEDADGYYRDRCVFSSDIDIYDTMSLNVKYSGGAFMSYSLTAHSVYEGYKLAISGTEGRIESESYWGKIGAFAGQKIYRIRVYDRSGEENIINLPVISGGHGGADKGLQELIFGKGTDNGLDCLAGSREGIMSAIIGIAANKSIKEDKAVYIKDLIGDI